MAEPGSHQDPLSPRRPVLRDVAAAAGVSKDTVSRALNRKPGVKEDLRKRIQLIARQLGYRPNPLVRAFQQRASRLIGVCSPLGVAMILFGELMSGISRALAQCGYDPLLAMMPPAGKGAASAVPRAIHERYVDGLIAIERLTPAIRAEVQYHQLPCVVVMADPGFDPDARLVTENPSASTGLAVDHLAGLGHRRIAGVYFGPVRQEDLAKSISPANPWTRGYLQTMARLHLPAVATEHPCLAVEDWLDQAFAQAAPTAIIAQDADSAGQVRLALERRGLRVPSDVSLICTNQSGLDLRDTRTFCTAVRLPWEQMGLAAAQAVVDRLEDRRVGDWAQPIAFDPVGITDYGTTAPAVRSQTA